MSLIRKIPKPDKPKKKRRELRWRKEKYKGHVKEHACVKCGSETNIQAAHVRLGTDGGMSVKPSDYYCVPLCWSCHLNDQHRIGEATFWAGFDLPGIMRELQVSSGMIWEIEQHKREFG